MPINKNTRDTLIPVFVWLFVSLVGAYLCRDARYVSAGDGIVLDRQTGEFFRGEKFWERSSKP